MSDMPYSFDDQSYEEAYELFMNTQPTTASCDDLLALANAQEPLQLTTSSFSADDQDTFFNWEDAFASGLIDMEGSTMGYAGQQDALASEESTSQGADLSHQSGSPEQLQTMLDLAPQMVWEEQSPEEDELFGTMEDSPCPSVHNEVLAESEPMLWLPPQRVEPTATIPAGPSLYLPTPAAPVTVPVRPAFGLPPRGLTPTGPSAISTSPTSKRKPTKPRGRKRKACPETLTPETEKEVVRRESNRLAAAKSRQKKIELFEAEVERGQQLMQQIERLQRERALYLQQLEREAEKQREIACR